MVKQLKVLELYAGTRSIGKAFEARGHKVLSVEWDEQHPNIDWYTDVNEVTAEEVVKRLGGRPDVVWMSPDCVSYSVAGIGHHRERMPDGSLRPKTEYGEFCDKTNQYTLQLIKELDPKVFFIENPRGGMRKMSWMQDIPRYTVTYCQYNERRMKPTDLWTNHPDPKFKPACKNGDPCHDSAPRGARTGTQAIKSKIDKSRIPELLCEHIVDISEELFKD